MKKGISYIIPIFILFLTNPLVGFSQKREKMDGALRAFIETPFMQKFKDLRLESENLVLTFKENKQNYTAAEINRVKTAYQKTVDKFNAQLLDIKADFMNERKLQYIQDFPEDYTSGLTSDINDLTSFYQSNLQLTIQDVTDATVDGNSLLSLVAELAKLVPGMVTSISELRSSVKKFEDTYLEEKLIGPHKFKSWDEINY
ncbi:MAG: hypothetical protein ACOVRG_06685 [Saprospiraceae bacterium]|jgi:hypothetical protein